MKSNGKYLIEIKKDVAVIKTEIRYISRDIKDMKANDLKEIKNGVNNNDVRITTIGLEQATIKQKVSNMNIFQLIFSTLASAIAGFLGWRSK